MDFRAGDHVRIKRNGLEGVVSHVYGPIEILEIRFPEFTATYGFGEVDLIMRPASMGGEERP